MAYYPVNKKNAIADSWWDIVIYLCVAVVLFFVIFFDESISLNIKLVALIVIIMAVTFVWKNRKKRHFSKPGILFWKYSRPTKSF